MGTAMSDNRPPEIVSAFSVGGRSCRATWRVGEDKIGIFWSPDVPLWLPPNEAVTYRQALDFLYEAIGNILRKDIAPGDLKIVSSSNIIADKLIRGSGDD
jgi:hypothetical protein